MSHLFLVRHGESYFNERKILTGTLDVPLTEKGVQQSLQLSSIINCKLDIVFTSTLLRSIETSFSLLRMHYLKYNQIPIFLYAGQYLDILTENMLPVYKTDLLNERNYGSIQGMAHDVIKQNYTQTEILSWQTTMYSAPFGGESLEDVKRRTDLFYEQYLNKYLYASLNILIICHQNTIKTLRMKLESDKYIANSIDNCGVLDYIFKLPIDEEKL